MTCSRESPLRSLSDECLWIYRSLLWTLHASLHFPLSHKKSDINERKTHLGRAFQLETEGGFIWEEWTSVALLFVQKIHPSAVSSSQW